MVLLLVVRGIELLLCLKTGDLAKVKDISKTIHQVTELKVSISHA